MVDLGGGGVLNLLLFYALMVPALFDQGFVLVTARSTPIQSLTRFQVQRIYLGKLDRLADTPITPVQLRSASPVQSAFEKWLFDESINLQNYWLEQKLMAGADPPMSVGSWGLLLIFVERNPGFIGFLEAGRVDELAGRDLKIIRIEDAGPGI